MYLVDMTDSTVYSDIRSQEMNLSGGCIGTSVPRGLYACIEILLLICYSYQLHQQHDPDNEPLLLLWILSSLNLIVSLFRFILHTIQSEYTIDT